MHKFAMLLKTYAGDLEYAKRLIQSYHRHNVEKIPLFVVIPQADIGQFSVMSDSFNLRYEEEFSEHLVTRPIHGIGSGYINQQIVKLAFWELGTCENYLCLDSDGEFIRDFRVSDFMFDDETPYTILVEDNELAVDPIYYATFWEHRKNLIHKIQQELGVSTRTMLTSHGFSILSAKVLKAFKEKYLDQNGKSYADILEIAPLEFSWYNMWSQKDQTIDIRLREPLFKCFHHRQQHIGYLQQGITLTDIARGYVGLVVNSNWSRGHGILGYADGNVYRASLSDVLWSFKWPLSQAARFVARLPARIGWRLRRPFNN
jgi:hypothetical protein